jgi:hypothetical protein
MISLNKDSVNTVVMTLTEKSQLPIPKYLFSFTNDNSGTQTLFNMDDQSGYARRYNQFELTTTGSTFVNLSAGTVDLEYGWGKYEVYESSSPTLFISGTTGRILEEGRYFVNGYPVTSNNANTIPNIYL